jgi:hypothetical protein
MGPQTLWNDLPRAYLDADWPRVEAIARILHDWLTRGGFPAPQTTGHAPAEDAWNRIVVLAVTTFLLNLASARQAGVQEDDG